MTTQRSCASTNPRPRGFSLVELSIVLVILGLLVGGVLSGQSLIRAAQLRSFISDVGNYRAAVHSFRDKYFELPGDMTKATMFWGSAGGNGVNAACDAAITASSPAICNGNGDGMIDANGNLPWGNSNFYNERFYFWKELTNAGLIAGAYSGRSNGFNFGLGSTPGVSVPALKLGGDATIGISWQFGPRSGHTDYYDGTYGFNALFLAKDTAQILKPEEAWNIDTKFDDGKPATGMVFAGKSSGSWMWHCTTTDVVATAEYRLNDTAIRCDIWLGV